MPVTFPDSISTYVISTEEDPADTDLSHTVVSGTTLLLCFVGHFSVEGASAVTWNSVPLTKVVDLETASAGGDVGGGFTNSDGFEEFAFSKEGGVPGAPGDPVDLPDPPEPPGGVVPEPSSIVLLGMGAFSMIGYGLRRKRKLTA